MEKLPKNFQENIRGGIQYQLKIVMNFCNFNNLVLTHVWLNEKQKLLVLFNFHMKQEFFPQRYFNFVEIYGNIFLVSKSYITVIINDRDNKTNSTLTGK